MKAKPKHVWYWMLVDKNDHPNPYFVSPFRRGIVNKVNESYDWSWVIARSQGYTIQRVDLIPQKLKRVKGNQ